MECRYDENGEMQIDIINGDERIAVPEIYFGKNAKLQDTVMLDFPIMDSHIKAIYKENIMEGYWTVRNKPNYHVPFVAHHGRGHRFTTNGIKPAMDVSGKWKTTFGVETDGAYPAIGEFDANGNDLQGTFLTETGDYRYLAGEVQGDDLMMSCFDGSHAFLFTAKIQENQALTGKFYSGNHYQTNWVAQKDENASLPNAYDLTKATKDKVEIALPNVNGDIVTLDDAKYKGKPKLVTIMGTWCPNCLDESRFLKEYFKNNPDKEVPIIAVAFERYKDKTEAIDMLKKYKERLDVPYDMLYGGYYSKSIATEVIGSVDKIISYPTLLFVNPDNTISSIYTGFSGPATSEFANFKQTFETELDKIRNY